MGEKMILSFFISMVIIFSVIIIFTLIVVFFWLLILKGDNKIIKNER